MVDILLVEDNQELRDLISAFLIKEGFSVCSVSTGEEGLQYLQSHQVGAIILDVILPLMDGFTFCKEVRQTYALPILIMSARSLKEDQLMGFELGADDYLKKPIDPEILCAKTRVLLQRYRSHFLPNKRLCSSDIQMDLDAHKVYLKNELLELNAKEYELLLLFLQNVGKTLHKDYIFQKIWGEDSFSEMQTLTVHIKMLRDKIEKCPKDPKRIQTVWGVGYRYEEI